MWSALVLFGCMACSASSHPSDGAARTLAAQKSPSFCASVDAALGQMKEGAGFRCLRVPNYLVTGFYGTKANPERSDFLQACFAGKSDAAARLRMTVRPAGQIDLSLRTERHATKGGSIDLSFLGPWAPELSSELREDADFGVRVELQDAEVRVLSSVPEILGQEYEAADSEPERREALERCILSLCANEANEPLVYTTKVLAAVPIVSVRAGARKASANGVRLAGSLGFELLDSTSSQQTFVVRAKEKLNVAALVEPARAAFEHAGTCEIVRRARVRRTATGALRELALRTLAGRELGSVKTEAARLRKLIGAERAFSSAEQGDLLSALEALEFASRDLSAPALRSGVCATVTLLGRLLTGVEANNRVHDTLLEVAQPLQRRLLDLANTDSLPCAEPAWFQDADGDGYGDKQVRVRGAAQPKGFVANALDCFDQNAEARPGQTKHFASHRGDGRFDYDCDGQEQPQKDLLAGGCRSITRFGIPIRCWAEIGWQTRVPRCGETGRWLADCEVSTFSCDAPDDRVMRQACR